MLNSRSFAAPYCLALIEDVSGGERPPFTNESLIVSTGTCITMGCQCDSEGETEFRLGARLEVDPGSPPIFRGRLKTPSRKLAIFSVPVTIGPGVGDIVLEKPVSQTETTISIWANHPTEPDQIIVGVE